MINKATILGIIKKKDFQTTKYGKFLCNLTVETHRSYKEASGSTRKMTTWHNINIFDKLAETANKHSSVGDLILIEGEINNKKQVENGLIKMIHSIIAEKIKIFKSKKSEYLDNVGNFVDDFDRDEVIL